MKLFLACLMMLTGSAWAEWVLFLDQEKAQFFYDPATIRKDGNMRRVWTLQNLIRPSEEGAMSNRIRVEYDCKEESYKILGGSIHSQPMTGGDVLHSFVEDNKWRVIAPDTASDVILKIVCAK
jgi:hypothetical protein